MMLYWMFWQVPSSWQRKVWNGFYDEYQVIYAKA